MKDDMNAEKNGPVSRRQPKKDGEKKMRNEKPTKHLLRPFRSCWLVFFFFIFLPLLLRIIWLPRQSQ